MFNLHKFSANKKELSTEKIAACTATRKIEYATLTCKSVMSTFL